MFEKHLEVACITEKIRIIRGHRVMLSYDLAALYGVDTKVLMQAAKRNIDRFPDDFMFKLSFAEVAELRSQIVTLGSSTAQTYPPYAFTEQGVAMLSSVLRSPLAIHMNIAIMRAFVKMRQVIELNADLSDRLIELETKYSDHDEKIQMIFAAIRELMTPPEQSKPPIGF